MKAQTPSPVRPAALALALPALLASLMPTGLGARETPAGTTTVKTRQTVSLSLADGNAPKGVRHYALVRIERQGQPTRRPKNMVLDSKTGVLSWVPTESQAGTYDLTFAIAEPPPRAGRTVRRRLLVKAGAITTDRGEVGKLLKAWYAEGSAAGNTGDFYDNRDRGHSRLNTGKFPQLDKVEYPEQLKQRRMDWALQLHFLFPHVTLGNSSTSSGPTSGGCNSRRAVSSSRMAAIMQRQYRNGHLYIYPEHRDHDAGHNGRGGYGDLFPANVPYLITSQGSSGSDRPFMEAVAFTLAAFRPEVKKRLIKSGLLMPTVQMILRACGKNVDYPKDYRTGKAHPTVFEGHNVDPLAMVKMAHEIRPETIPPMAQLSVVEEDDTTGAGGIFEPGASEKLFDTPSAIARVARSTRFHRRMVLSAKGSHDVNRRALTYHWVVLRGDPARVRIKPLEKDASRVELRVDPHDRRPIHDGAAMESTRVDVGLFVNNGAYDSPPAFVCFTYLPNEARTYDADGRIVEVAYDWGDSTIGHPTDNARADGYDVADWPALLKAAAGPGDSLPAKLLGCYFGKAQSAAFGEALAELRKAEATEAEPRQAWTQADEKRKAARKTRDEARKALDKAKKASKGAEAAQKTLDAAEKVYKATDKPARDAKRKLDDARRAGQDILTRRREALGASVKDAIEKALNAIKDTPDLYVANADRIEAMLPTVGEKHARAFKTARDEIVRRGILAAGSPAGWKLQPALADRLPKDRPLTKWERNRLEWFHVALIRHVLFPGAIHLTYRRNFVSGFLTVQKNWRDVYHYDPAGRLTGWTRYVKGKTERFAADGALVTKTDRLGRPIEAKKVQYLVDRDSRRMPRELKYMTLPTVVRYEYADESDRVGHVVSSP